MKVLARDELHRRGVITLGLDPDACDLTFTESIAASLRRAAGFLCPCSRRTLVRAVTDPLETLVDNCDDLLEITETTLEAMISYGDLLEEFEVAAVERPNRISLLYAAPPSFIYRESGAVLLLGIVPDHHSPLPDHFENRVQYIGHSRRLVPESHENLRVDLERLGLVELTMDMWNRKVPPHESFTAHLQRFDRELKSNPGALSDLEILNSAKPVDYYRGRWEVVRNQTGRFVARRHQAYGNNLWCYVELDQGQATKIVDLPTLDGRLRGCDEAWRLQAAIDAARDQPQRYRVRPSTDHSSRIVDLFSPVPMWAHRRWDSIGEPAPSSSCLFSYKFPINELEQELNFIRERLWLAPSP